jgi:replicative DNA helicase
MDISGLLFSKVILEDDSAIQKAVELPSEIFVDKDRDIFTFIQNYYREYGSKPTADVLCSEFPTFTDRYEEPSEPIEYYIAQLKKQFLSNLLLTLSKDIAISTKSNKDPFVILDELRGSISKADTIATSTRDEDWISSGLYRFDDYKQIQAKHGVEGLITPFPSLNGYMQLVDGTLNYIVARQGVGKTWLLCRLAIHAWECSNKTIMFDTREMPINQIGRRLDALKFNLSYEELRKGDLNSSEEQRWHIELQRQSQQELNPFHLLEESGGVMSLASKIDKYKGGILFIDGAYMIPDDRSRNQNAPEWQRITNVMRDLKRLAKQKNIPIVVSLQFSKEASNTNGNASNIALGDVAKEADCILGLFRSEDQKNSERATIKVLKNREGTEMGQIELDWFLSKGIIKEVDHDVDYSVVEPKNTQPKDQGWSSKPILEIPQQLPKATQVKTSPPSDWDNDNPIVKQWTGSSQSSNSNTSNWYVNDDGDIDF